MEHHSTKKENMQRIRKDEGNHHPPHPCLPRLTSSSGPKQTIARCGKRKITKTNDDQQELPELPSDLLELISKRLDVVGFCAFGAVCKSWWEVYAKSKEDFLESQAPLAVLIPSHAKRACYLYDMANGNTKKVMLPNLRGKHFVGCSAGYMILEDKNHQISLINLLNGHEPNFNSPTLTLKGMSINDLIIFTPTSSFRSCFVLAISYDRYEIQISDSRGRILGLYFGQPWAHIEFFKGQVYVVTKNARLGMLKITASVSRINWLVVRNAPIVRSTNLKLVASENQLLMVDFVPKGHLSIFKMDFNSMEWVKLDKLGDQALFLGGTIGASIRKPGKWGGISNCVYYLETKSTMCCIYSMEAELIDKLPIVENPASSKLFSTGWYYPHQCMKVGYLIDV